MRSGVAIASGASSARLGLNVPVMVALQVAASAALHLQWPLPEDTAWLLTVAERVLAGRTLYTEIAELNPPMSVWLYIPWAWLAPKIGMSADRLVVFATIAISLIMIAVAERILRSAGLLRSRAAWWMVAIAALIFTPVLAFAQREHFAVIFAVPMLMAIATRAERRGLDPWAIVLAGLCGGLTMAIKPHFALALLLPLAYVAAAHRSLRPFFAPECLLAGALLLLYAAAVAVFYPAFFSEMLPIVLAIYVVNQQTWIALAARPFPIVTLLCLVAWFAQGGLRAGMVSKVLFAGAVGFLAAYFLQGQGWSYHALPALALATLGFGLSVFAPGGFVHEGRPRGVLAAAATVIMIVTLVFVFGMNVRTLDADNVGFLRPLRAVLEPLGPHLKIAIIADDLAVASPVHRLVGATLVNSGPSLWMAGNARLVCLRDVSPEKQRTCAEVMLKERAILLKDLQRNPPDVLLVQTHRFDWLAWAREDPALAKITAPFRLSSVVKYGALRAEVMLAEHTPEPGLRPSIEPGR